MRSFVAVLVALALVGPARAQLTEAQANAQLKAATKDAKKSHAASVAQRTTAAIAAIEAFSAAAPNGPAAAFDALFTALESFQTGLYEDIVVLQSQVATAGSALLQEFSDSPDVLGLYPSAFYEGLGGPLDDSRAAMDLAQSKAVAKVRKKLEKAASKLAKTSSARLSWFLEPAARQGTNSFVQESTIAYTRVPLVIHTALALSFVDSASSGRIRVGGLGQDTEDISVTAVNEGTPQVVPVDFFELGSPYWHVLIDDEGQGVVDGNVLVFAQQDTAGTSFGAYLSIR